MTDTKQREYNLEKAKDAYDEYNKYVENYPDLTEHVYYKSGPKKGQIKKTILTHENIAKQELDEKIERVRLAKKYNLPNDWFDTFTALKYDKELAIKANKELQAYIKTLPTITEPIYYKSGQKKGQIRITVQDLKEQLAQNIINETLKIGAKYKLHPYWDRILAGKMSEKDF